ncbi:SH3 domain-containing protein [Leptospira bourretii]|nr:SH3 domain-containing protein [Leptospira bourretii]TGK78902.1 SH3 domain-containing protein [Leptospira bourretii]TGL40807.1 SH3 domain-containing protein [Leptospira bourretii]
MVIRIFILLLIIITTEIESKDLFPSWRKSLENFNYQLPEELYDKYKEFGYDGAGYFKDSKGIYIRKTRFPNEEINYAIGIRNQKDKFLSDSVFLIFLFNNEELRMITTKGLYTKIDDYSFTGMDYRFGRSYEFIDGNLVKISCLDKGTNFSQPIEISKKEYCGEIIHLDAQGNISNVTDSKNPCSYICNSRYMPYSQPGFYYTTVDQLKLRQSPSSKSDVIMSLPLDTKVQVIEDTFKAERLSPYVNGNWVKVILEDGKEGFLYGFYLRFEKEPNLNLILQKAEEWKKTKNKK